MKFLAAVARTDAVPVRANAPHDVGEALVTDGQGRSLWPKTVSPYLEAVRSFRSFLEPDPSRQTLADLTLDAGRLWAAGLAVGRRPATVAIHPSVSLR